MKFKLQLCRDEKNHCFEMFFFYNIFAYRRSSELRRRQGVGWWGGGHNLSEALKIKGRLI